MEGNEGAGFIQQAAHLFLDKVKEDIFLWLPLTPTL